MFISIGWGIKSFGIPNCYTWFTASILCPKIANNVVSLLGSANDGLSVSLIHIKVPILKEILFYWWNLFYPQRNYKYFYEYSDVNLRYFQRELKINIWTGIINRYNIGPVILPNRLTVANYLDSFQNTLLDLL